MLVFKELKKDIIYSSSLALGVFDGIHAGHKKIILNAIKRASSSDAVSAVVTFSSPPKNLIRKIKTRQIISLEKKLELFEELGIQATMVLDFTPAIANMLAYDYLKNILVGCLHPKFISVGFNHHFGKNREGSGAFLEQYAEKFNYGVDIIEKISLNSNMVSSSSIRSLLSFGEVEKAAQFLGRAFSVKGEVIEGKKRGRMLGFPTANLKMPPEIVPLAEGVYAGFVEVDGGIYDSMINFGKRPSYGDIEENLIEAHLLDFSEEIYGKTIEVAFVEKLRDEIKFTSEEELKNQLLTDLEKTKEIHCNIKV